MLKNSVVRVCTMFIIALAMPAMLFAETIGVFFDSNVEQIKFAAGDVKLALESKGFTVEMLPLTSIASPYANKKVVITLASDSIVTNNLKEQGGTLPTGLGEQAYGLRTTTAPQTSYWVLGGDVNGAMYGGLQIAENIKFYGFSGTYNNQESPKILKRGIKLNVPFDVNSTTYFNANISTSSRHAIANVWDMTFWTTWFDEMARNRYNVLSVWNNHPFTSMIKMADYPDVAIKDVKGYPDFYNDNDKTGAVIKTMTIDQKIEFWRSVMAYAKSRGFSFYLFNWNLFLYGAEGKYGIVKDVTNPTTITYLRKCMYELLKTYPDLDGFGVTQGEAMSKDDAKDSYFLGATYGMGMADYANENPERKLNFIHRWHMADFTSIQKNFTELLKCPNVTFDMSFKYSSAHMYSSTRPDFMNSSDVNFLKVNNVKSWFTVRNDDFYYHNWGSPAYAREYLNNIPGQGDWFKGFYMGSDGFNPTRTFFSKNSVTQGTLEIQRQWYMFMIWGRLSYNPNTSDDVFKNYMTLKYPEVSTNDLFTAWSKVSAALPKVGEMLFDDFKLDFHWYPENCQSKDAFLTIANFAASTPRPASGQCGIPGTAANSCNGKVTSFTIADQIEADASSALSLVSTMVAPANSELGVTITTIKAMSYLAIYYAYKIRGATYSITLNKTAEAKNAMGTAYCWWKKYTNLMDANYKGMSCQRSAHFATWHQHDAAVLKEYTDLGGTGSPICGDKSYNVTLSSINDLKGSVLGAGLYNPGDEVTITAVPETGYRFTLWMENNEMVSSDMSYKFTITSDRQIVGYFVENDSCGFPWNEAGFTVNKASVNKIYGPIDLSCAPYGVNISLSIEGIGNDNSDFCKVYYKIDGGALKTIAEHYGSFAVKFLSVSNIKGENLEIIINCANTYSDEFYYINNVKVVENYPTSINKTPANGIAIFPNPASKMLKINFPDDLMNREVKIFNSIGLMVYNTQTKNSYIELDVHSLNLKGMILVHLETDSEVSNHKIIVQ